MCECDAIRDVRAAEDVDGGGRGALCAGAAAILMSWIGLEDTVVLKNVEEGPNGTTMINSKNPRLPTRNPNPTN